MSATYYVSATGNDGAAGTSPATAWQTISKVNAHTFVPGDTILFEGGSTFTGGLYIHNVASGSANPVTLGSYGTGKAAISTAAGTTAAYIYQMGGVVVQNLNFTGPGASTANQAGIFFYNDAASTVYPYIRIDGCTIIGYTNGIAIGGGNGTSGYSDVRITNCDCHANQLNGINFFGAANYCHSSVYVGYCNAYNNLGKAGLSSNSGSGILLGSVNGGTVEYCVAHDNGANNTFSAGPVGIWTYASNNVTIQYCESYNNSTGSGGGDGDGFDIDGGCTGCIIQYCYSHGNEGAGLCLFQYAGASTFANNIIRYCISENDGYAGIGLWGATSSDKITNSQIYNNTIFAGLAPGLFVYNSNLSGITAKNNIFIATGGHALVDHPSNVGITFDHNDYFAKSGAFLIWWNGTSYGSLGAWAQDGAGLSADPQLANSGGGGTIGNATLLGTLLAYKILSFFSPVVDAGATISSPGATDFYGNALFYGGPDIGANEYNPPLSPSLTQANPVPGTVVGSGALLTPGGGQGIQGVAGAQGIQGPAGSGSGDMLKSVYDTNADNIVDKAAALSTAGAAHQFWKNGNTWAQPDWADLTGTQPAPTGHQASHVTGTDQIPSASISVRGLMPIANNVANNFYASDATQKQVTYAMLGGSQPAPVAHAASHITGGADIIATATSAAVGLVPITPNNAAQFLAGGATAAFSALPANTTAQAGTVGTAPNDVLKFYRGDATWNNLPVDTETSSTFVIPAAASTVTIAINAVTWGKVGQQLYISDGTHFLFCELSTRTSNTSWIVTCRAYQGNDVSGTMAIAALVRLVGVGQATSSLAGLLPTPSGTATDFFGGDAAFHAHSTVPLDTLGATTDITTRNATSAAHGLLVKVSGTATDFVGGDNACHAHSTVALDTLGAPTDIVTLNASTTAHGLLKKLSNVATQYMDGTGNWSVPPPMKPFRFFQAALEYSPPATLYAVFNTQNARPHLEFADAATNGAYFFGMIPQGANLASGLLVRLKWKAVVATPSGNVRWNVAFERLNTAESADSFDTAVPFTSAVGAQSVIVEAAITVTTIDGLTAGDGFGLLVQRLGADAADTLTAAAVACLRLVSVETVA